MRWLNMEGMLASSDTIWDFDDVTPQIDQVFMHKLNTQIIDWFELILPHRSYDMITETADDEDDQDEDEVHDSILYAYICYSLQTIK